MSQKSNVTINGTNLKIKEYNGQRIVTLKEIDAVHERPQGTARRNFNANSHRLIDGVDYFAVNQPDEIRTLGIERPQGGTPQTVTLITESGYLMLVKSFTDDLAWAVQRQLVNAYFRSAKKQRGNTGVDASRAAIAEAKLNNSRARLASEWRKLAELNPVLEYRQICAHYASAVMAGKEALPLPEVTERTYTAEDVGKILGVSAQKIGRTANLNHLKTPEYGKEVWDKAKNCDKQVPTWRYNDRGVSKLKDILQSK